MNPDLQSMSDWLRVNLLGQQVEWPAHDRSRSGTPWCTRCLTTPKPLYGICRPKFPLLSAPEQYHLVIEAMMQRGQPWHVVIGRLPDNIGGFARGRAPRNEPLQYEDPADDGFAEWNNMSATIGEAIVRAAFAALGGEA